VRFLVTRPQPDGERTAAALRARGHDVVVAPLMRIEPIGFELSAERPQAVVLTSANAARAVAGHSRREELTALTAFTVGLQTARAACAAGFHRIRSADGDRDDLARLLRGECAGQPGALLYLAGEDRAGDLAAELATEIGVPVVTVVAYRAVKAERFPPAVAAALGEGALDGVLHFSRRSAESYLACAARAGIGAAALAPLHLCLSAQVAEPLAAAGAAAIRIAPRPDEAAMIELASIG
jgi:uroporphyrinogen-III synthase